MLVREWSGTVRADAAAAYLELMRRHAIPDYLAVPGNLGAPSHALIRELVAELDRDAIQDAARRLP